MPVLQKENMHNEDNNKTNHQLVLASLSEMILEWESESWKWLLDNTVMVMDFPSLTDWKGQELMKCKYLLGGRFSCMFQQW